MYIYTHAYIHTDMRTYRYVYNRYVYIQIFIYTYIYICVYKGRVDYGDFMCKYIHMQTRTHIHVYRVCCISFNCSTSCTWKIVLVFAWLNFTPPLMISQRDLFLSHKDFQTPNQIEASASNIRPNKTPPTPINIYIRIHIYKDWERVLKDFRWFICHHSSVVESAAHKKFSNP